VPGTKGRNVTWDSNHRLQLTLGRLANGKKCQSSAGCTLQLDSKSCCTGSWDDCFPNWPAIPLCDNAVNGSSAALLSPWPKDLEFGGSTAFGVSAWVKPSSTGLDNNPGPLTLISRNYGYDVDQFILMRGNAMMYGEGTAAFFCASFHCTAWDCKDWGGNPEKRFCASGGNIPMHSWTHVVGTLYAGKLSVYLNGTKVDSLQLGPNYQNEGVQFTKNPETFVGSHPQWNQFQGEMDCVGLFHMALTDDDVARHYMQQKDTCGCTN
jgi:hypothetical protein